MKGRRGKDCKSLPSEARYSLQTFSGTRCVYLDCSCYVMTLLDRWLYTHRTCLLLIDHSLWLQDVNTIPVRFTRRLRSCDFAQAVTRGTYRILRPWLDDAYPHIRFNSVLWSHACGEVYDLAISTRRRYEISGIVHTMLERTRADQQSRPDWPRVVSSMEILGRMICKKFRFIYPSIFLENTGIMFRLVGAIIRI